MLFTTTSTVYTTEHECTLNGLPNWRVYVLYESVYTTSTEVFASMGFCVSWINKKYQLILTFFAGMCD